MKRLRTAAILVAEEKDVPEILERAGKEHGFRYAGIVLTDRDGTGESIRGVKIVSDLKNAADYICREWVDEVFVCAGSLRDLKTREAAETAAGGIPDPERSGETDGPSGIAEMIERCREMAVPVRVLLPETDGGKSFAGKAGGCGALTAAADCAGPGMRLLKRTADIAGGLAGSVTALILIAVLGPVIKKESPGPVLFRQTRIGRNGRRFTCYKLRSMDTDAEERKKELEGENLFPGGLMFRVKFDPRIIGNRIVDGKRVTGIGERIRSCHLDEFPQFFNVLKGDMSLVGTRPPTEDEWERYSYHHRARMAVKPGITGMWQVSGRMGDTDFEEVVRLDTEYIRRWSPGLDFRILMKTIGLSLRRKPRTAPEGPETARTKQTQRGQEGKEMSFTVRIIIAAHKPYRMPEDEMYLPVQVGAAGKESIGYQRDDEGENISGLNSCFSELTGIYWAWKNAEADYLGLAHYRRHFSSGGRPEDLWDSVLKKTDIGDDLGRIRVFVPEKRKYRIETLYSHYKHTHDISHLDETRKIIVERCPEYLESFDRICRRTWGYMFNMTIMEAGLFDRYCAWLFGILYELHGRIGEEGMTPYDRRYGGRISEIIFNAWLDQQLRSGTLKKQEIREIPLVYLEKTDWLKKGLAFLQAKFMGKKYRESF